MNEFPSLPNLTGAFYKKLFTEKVPWVLTFCLFFPELCRISFCVRCVLPWKDKWVCPHAGPASFLEGFLRKPHGGDHNQHLTVPLLFVKLTVHVPLDASGREFQGFVDLLQDSLQLLLLSNLWLRDLSNVQLLTLKFLWSDKGKTAVIASHRQPWFLYVRSHIYSLNKHVRHTSLYLSVVLLHFTDVFFHKLKAKPSISKKIMTPLLWSGTKPVISLRDAGMWRTSPLLVWRWHCWRQYCENLVIVSWIPKL